MTGGTANSAPQAVTLTLSPARDLTIDVDTIELGTSHRVAQAGSRLGGKGINVARVLAALGRSVYVQGPVNAADWPEDTGSDDGLLWDLTPTPAQLRRSYAIVESDGRATLFNEHASEHPAEVWAQIEEKLRLRLVEPQVRALAISGSTPKDLPEGLIGRVVSAAHAAGVIVVVDTSGPALITAAAAGADWLKPNVDELAEIAAGAAGRAVAGPEGAGARALIAAGAGAVLVSRGEEGMVLIDRTGERSAARLDEPVRGNPTGAGDAVVAALLSRLTARPDSGPDEATLLRKSDASSAPDVEPTLSDAEVDTVLPDTEVEAILTDAVAVSAAAVLMPQAGAIHPSWKTLRDHVQITSPTARTAHVAPTAHAVPTVLPRPAAPAAPTPSPVAPVTDATKTAATDSADHLGE
ncbi:1-phosphofructokinase family hexose kinase [Brevibacterium atlanticum]|uniref:1-phosphofructokinase family hexose kinase n=1 Tax=Brevibacterium atlanticum TaxID=2697563 RepID=UPI00141E5C2C|nr:PfkB family carbohydrate kinase [Brevibacterium atlanticum]